MNADDRAVIKEVAKLVNDPDNIDRRTSAQISKMRELERKYGDAFTEEFLKAIVSIGKIPVLLDHNPATPWYPGYKPPSLHDQSIHWNKS